MKGQSGVVMAVVGGSDPSAAVDPDIETRFIRTLM
jgi:hypothetical protein